MSFGHVNTKDLDGEVMDNNSTINHILISAIERLPIGFFWKDTKGRYLGCNPHSLKLSGVESEQDLIGKTHAELNIEFNKALIEDDESVLKHGKTIIAKKMKVKRVQGSGIFEVTKIPLTNQAGKIIGLLGIIIDISSKHEAEQQLQERTALLHSIFNAIPDFVVYKDLQGNILECNRAALALVQKEKTDIIGKTFKQLLPLQCAEKSELYDDLLKNNNHSVNYKMEFNLDDKEVYVDVHKHPVIQNDKVVGIVSVSRDLKERRRAQQKIAALTNRDQLTQFLNRATFLKSLKQINKEESWAVILIDIKKFGQLNNLYGSEIGDQILIHVCNTIKQLAPDDAHLARIQGDCFAILTNQASSQTKLRHLCNNLSQSLNRQAFIANRLIDLTVCMGAANYPYCGQEINQLLSCSEQALLRAREHIDSSFTLFDPVLEAQAEAESRLLEDLKMALHNRAIDLYYQPIIDAQSGQTLGVEALARWHHPVLGLIMPDKFIPLAEKNNLISTLGEIVLEKACQQLAQWQKMQYDLFIAVNLSPIQFKDPDLLSKIKHCIEHYQIPADRLELEVTESALMESNIYVDHMLQEMIKLGIRLSIDDFGTGYCSLSYLKNMPAHKLKIDRSFVDELELDHTTTAITRSVIGLARELDITVTAEGVEEESQMSWLKAQSCDQFQGYLFSRPLPSDKFHEWYLTHSSK